jgi:putative nucleotidyltransferase with HDIG domain
MLSMEEAARLLKKHVKNTQIRRHSTAVAEIMGRIARRLGMNQDEWRICGLLHDLDREMIHGDMSKHGLVAAQLLDNFLPRNCLQAIRAHDHRTGVSPRSLMDKALIAADSVMAFLSELEGRERVSRLGELDSNSFQIVFEDKAFRKLRYLKSRIEICREIGISLDEFLSYARESFQMGELRRAGRDGAR